MNNSRINDVLVAVSNAIATREDFFKQGGKIPPVSRRLANPLNLRRWRDPSGEPYPEVNGFAQFPECEREGCAHPDHPCEVGWRAGRAQVRINVAKRGLTFLEFFAGKRGVYDGFCRDRSEAPAYARYVAERVCRDLGVDARCGDPACVCAVVAAPRCYHAVVADLLRS